MVYGYCRVSARCQVDNNSIEAQEREILARYPDAIMYTEQHTAKTTDRPVLNAVIARLAAGDTLAVCKLDRLARNTAEGLDLIQSLFARDVAVHVLNIGLLENSGMGKFFVTTLLAVAELERTSIAERMQAGKEIARTKPGYQNGRPKKYDKTRIDHALALLGECSYAEVERRTGISKSTLLRASRASKPSSAPTATGTNSTTYTAAASGTVATSTVATSTTAPDGPAP